MWRLVASGGTSQRFGKLRLYSKVQTSGVLTVVCSSRPLSMGLRGIIMVHAASPMASESAAALLPLAAVLCVHAYSMQPVPSVWVETLRWFKAFRDCIWGGF